MHNHLTLHLILTAHEGWFAVFCHLYFKATSYLRKNMQWRLLLYSRQYFSVLCISPVSGSDFWDHFSVPSYFLPPWPWVVRPKGYFLDRPLIFSPGDVSRYFLPPILSSSGCSAEQAVPTCTLFTAVSQVSDLNSPCSWLHFLKPSLHILSCCTICGATPHALELLAVILHSAFIKLSRSHSPGDGGRL